MISEGVYRSGSAPPTMEGSMSASGGLFGGHVSDELRSDPAYVSYYYSNVNANPRLPTPLLLSREEWTGRREGGSRSGGVGFIGEERENGFRVGSRQNIGTGFSQYTLGSRPGGVGFIGEGRENGFRVGSRQNIGTGFNQEDISRTSVRRHPSLSISRNSFDNSFADSGLTRSITPDPQLIGRVSSPRIPPIGRMNSIDKRNVSLGPKIFDYVANGTNDHSSLATALSNMSISTNGVVNKNGSSSSDSHSLDSPNSLCSYGFGGYPINPGSPSMLSSPTSNLPPLFENNAAIADFDSRGFNLGPNLFTRDGNRNVDPMYLQNLRRNQFDDPTMARQGIGNSCSDLVGLQRAYLEALLLSQKAQYGNHFHGRYGNMNKDCSYRNQRCGVGMSYPVFPNSPVGSFPHRYGERSIHFPSGLRKMPGGMMGPWHPEIDGNMHESFMSSSLLDEFKSNKTRCFELSEIAGHIVEFSADQYGSRFIQQKLETATPDEINLVYDEIRPQALSLMTDVFGNYVVQKFFEHGTPSQIRELANQLIGNVLNFSLQMYGCRVIQKAIEVVELDLQKEMVAELDGHIMRCIRDQNGNHVIQKCIECIPEDAIQFVITVFYDQVVTLSSHPYGCRVIQRVLEHCHDPETQIKVMDEIMKSVCSLTQDQYGNYVVQHVLEHGKPEERSAIINKLVGQIVHLSQQKFASNVIEKCLTFGSPTERQTLVNEMLGSTDENDPLQVMMKDQFANYVVQKVLETCDDQQLESILNRIKDHLNTLKKYTYGKHIVARVEKLVVAGERRISGLMLSKSALDGIEKEV